MRDNRSILWLRWTLANGLAELACLEASYPVLLLITNNLNFPHLTFVQAYVLMAVAGAIIEATTVGLAQAWLIHMVFPSVRRVAWWAATLLGSLLAYALAWWPVNWLMDYVVDNPPYRTFVNRPFLLDPLLLWVLPGAITGASIAFVQWLVLRGQVRRSWEWIEGNTLAWAGGFLMILFGLSFSLNFSVSWQVRLVTAEMLLVVGLIVAAFNGYYFLRLAGRNTTSRFIRPSRESK
jgi:multisubunit Na+/H+ antiporter MnhB subunit